MELSELQHIWKEYDLKIDENTQIDKCLLKEVLIRKPIKKINWLQLKALLQLIAPAIVLFLFFTRVKLREPGLELYIGISLFLCLVLLGYVWAITYYLLLRRIAFSESALTVKSQLIKIKRYKIRTLQWNYLLWPPTILSLYLMLNINSSFNVIFNQAVIPVLLCVVVFILFSHYRFISLNVQFNQLNKELEEIQELEG